MPYKLKVLSHDNITPLTRYKEQYELSSKFTPKNHDKIIFNVLWKMYVSSDPFWVPINIFDSLCNT